MPEGITSRCFSSRFYEEDNGKETLSCRVSNSQSTELDLSLGWDAEAQSCNPISKCASVSNGFGATPGNCNSLPPNRPLQHLGLRAQRKLELRAEH